MDPLVLALDIGTSSMRALLFDGAARLVPDVEGRAATPVRMTADGGVEIDPAALLQAFAACIDELLARAGPLAGRIVAVGSTTLVGNILGVDAAFRPVTPIYTWADTRATAAAA